MRFHRHLLLAKSIRPVAALAVIVLLCTVMLNSLAAVKAEEPCEQHVETFAQRNTTTTGKFYCYWLEKGREDVFGIAVTNAQLEADDNGINRLTQWFERARFVLDEEKGVILGEIGKQARPDQVRQIDPDFAEADKLTDPDFTDKQQRYFERTHHNVRFRFLKYWNDNGGNEQLGDPISEERLEFDPSSNKTYVMQWFEKARLEYHPEATDPKYIIQRGRLGAEQKDPIDFVNKDSYTKFLWKVGRNYKFLATPNSVFVDGQGLVYVSDRASGRITKYSREGKLINYWFLPTVQAIAGIPADKNSSSKDQPLLYAITERGQSIQVLKTDGEFSELKLKDTGNPDSSGPNVSMTVDSSGNFYLLKAPQYVTSPESNLVWRYSKEGKAEGSFVRRAAVSTPTGLAVSTTGIYISNGETGSYQLFPTGQSTNNEVPPKYLKKDGGNTPFAMSITVDTNGTVYVGQSGRINRFASNGAEQPQIGIAGSQPGALRNPAGLATDKQGFLYVADPANHRVTKYDQSGQAVLSFGKVETDNPADAKADSNLLSSARGLAVTGGTNSEIYVVDSVKGSIVVFNSNGGGLRKLSVDGITHLAVAPDGTIYALDSRKSKITQLAPNATQPNFWQVKQGRGNGELLMPSGIAVSSNGTVYISDTGNQRIVWFTKDGKFINQVGKAGTGRAEFGGTGLNDVYSGPTSLAINEQNGTLYAVDPANSRIQKFDLQGNYKNEITDVGAGRPFKPIAISAPLTNRSNLNNNYNAGLYVAAADALYKLDNNDKKTGFVVQDEILASGGDMGDGSPINLTNIAADGSGSIYTTDAYGRLQKFALRS